MVRSYWIGPVILVLAVTALAWGQVGSTGSTPAAPKDHTMTVQEAGKPPLKCRILKMWHQPDGSRAFQVLAVANGEIITIVQPKVDNPDAPPQTKIYHWGDECKAPAGAPPAPIDATVFTAKGDVITTTRTPSATKVSTAPVWASAPESQPRQTATPTPALAPTPRVASPMVASAHGQA